MWLSLARPLRIYVGRGLSGQWKFWRRDKMPLTKLLRRHRWVRVISYIRRHCSVTKILGGSKFHTLYENKATKMISNSFCDFFPLSLLYIKEFVTDAISLLHFKHVSFTVDFIIYTLYNGLRWFSSICFYYTWWNL